MTADKMAVLKGYMLLALSVTLTMASSSTPQPQESNVDQLPKDVRFKDGDLLVGLIAHVRSYSVNPVCGTGLAPLAMYTIPSAVAYAVDVVNAMENILPNISVGYVIFDDCMRDIPVIPRILQMVPLLPDTATNRTLSVGQNYEVIAGIGPQSSPSSIVAATAFSFFQIPLVGASATSDELSDKVKYSNYFRVIGPDRYQSQAVVDFMAAMNWTYISVAYIEADYGYNGNKFMIKLAAEAGVCIEESYPVGFDYSDDDYLDVVLDMMAPKRRARVIMLYLYPPRIVKFLRAAQRAGAHGKFIFIMPDCMVVHMLYGLHDVAVGSFHMHLQLPPQPKFLEYYESIDPWIDSPDDPWMPMLWEAFFTCSMEEAEAVRLGREQCKNHTSLRESPNYFFEDTSLPFTDAVYAISVATDALIKDHCPEAVGDRAALRRCVRTRGLLAQYLHKVSYDAPSGMHVEFDENGDMVRPHDLAQLQVSPEGRYHFVVVGSYTPATANLEVHKDMLQWDPRMTQFTDQDLPESVCSYPCQYDEVRLQGEVECCWDCRACRNTEVVSENGTKCIECPLLHWPDEAKRGCVAIEPSYLTWSQPYGWGMLILATTGLTATGTIFAMMLHHGDRRVIKGSSQEVSLLIIIGCGLSFLTIPTFILRPDHHWCILSRAGFGVAPAFIFGPLAIKLIRIYRIFKASSEFKRNVWFVSTQSQLVFCAVVIAIQMAVTVVTSVLFPAYADLRMPIRTERYVELQCDLNELGILTPLCYNLLLTIISAGLGFLSRKLPDNFNESWYIFVSVCTTLFLWIAVLPTYFTAFYAYHKAILLAFALYLNSTLSLVCLFGPKLYAVYYMEDGEIKVSNFKDNVKQPVQSRPSNETKVTEVHVNQI